MTFNQVQEKFNKRFWWVLILLVLFNAVGFSWMQAQTYNTLFNLKINLNKDFYEIESYSQLNPNRIIVNENSLASSYSLNSTVLSKYFQDFLLSGSTIQKLKDFGALNDMNFTDKPSYTVNLVGGAILEVRNEFTNEADALKFNDSLKKVTENETLEWNQNKPQMLQISLNNSESKVVAKNKPIQVKILPSFAALVFGLTVVLIIPIGKRKL
jgi:hypothetical protein